jgi:hypothetical protein
MSKNKCKFCGVEAGKYAASYPCGSWHTSDDAVIHRSTRCERDELRQRFDAAIIRAERAIRFGLTREGDILCVFARDLDEVVEILRGNSPTISEGSP